MIIPVSRRECRKFYHFYAQINGGERLDMVQLRVIQGDITKLDVDAIVNAANSSLLGGGGVDGAIHRAGGKEILEACKKIGGCETGEAVITTAGKMKARYVIHTVGPVWKGGDHNEDHLLASCYRRSLEIAVSKNVRNLAFPNISTGVYHFPKERAVRIAVNEVERFIDDKDVGDLKDIIFVCFDPENKRHYEKRLKEDFLN